MTERIDQARSYYEEGRALMESGDMAAAIVPLAAATTPNRQVRAPSMLAEALLAIGDRLKAHEIASLALQRDPNNAKALALFAATVEEYRRHNWPEGEGPE